MVMTTHRFVTAVATCRHASRPEDATLHARTMAPHRLGGRLRHRHRSSFAPGRALPTVVRGS